MLKKRFFEQKIAVTLLFFTLAFVLLTTVVFHECRQLAIGEAEKNLAGFLLTHRAIRSFVEDVQKPEIYRLKREKHLYEQYFSPRLLSSTFIARNIKDAQNRERRSLGLEEFYFKFASRNPRNPINQADADELTLLEKFNRGDLIESKSVVYRNGVTALYYALPISPNRDSCMLCHGNPADAPRELVDHYGDKAGFYEKNGEIRALMSVRIPLAGLLAGARRTAMLLSLVAFLLLGLAFWVVAGFLRRLEFQEQIAVEKSDYLNSILQSSEDTAIIAGDGGCRLRYFNLAAEKMFQVPADEMVGNSLEDFGQRLGVDNLERLLRAVNLAREQGFVALQLETRGRFIQARISRISGEQGSSAGFLIMAIDISGLLREENEREEIRSRLQKAEKMESIGLMAGGVAHDLNNILSGIVSYPELMLRRLPADSPLCRQVEAMRQSGLRAAAVVADLLTVARGVASKKETHDLNQIVSEYLDSPEFLKLCEQHPEVGFRNQTYAGELNILCSPVHIKKCLMNLSHNAAEAMSEPGICRILTGSRFLTAVEARGFNAPAGDYAFVLIEDDGPGISPQHINHIFEPFYSTKKMGRSGTGLGLSVVWNTVKEHHGLVTVDSGDRGTVFGLYFPRLKEAALAADDPGLRQLSLKGQGQSILVVDDEEQMRDIAMEMLRELNYRAACVASGEEALDYLQRQSADLVLLDMLMEPGINGRQTYERILSFRPGQRALVVSGFSASAEVSAALRLGAGGFLGKPYSLDQLGLALRRAFSPPPL